MMQQTLEAMRQFSRRYCEEWQQQTGHLPYSTELYGIDSPCEVSRDAQGVYWQPQPFSLPPSLDAVERGLEISLQPAVTGWYTAQFAGDMQAEWFGMPVTLLQVWNEEDFSRVQENLIGHLVMKRRLKQSPTLFIAATDHDTEIISICNLSGEVIREALGTKKREVLSETVDDFLNKLAVVVTK
ncbi:SecY-interacting protein [Tatumella citrea]|uniref:Protein Syd n=1 Tax=Tatumella citrea TaxID=53336 RepID=A0A1Y0LHQ6_TATCI|nr:SecY-interacting protein [Tatumella citrea]ARU93140.1 SecY-interacting protein [Tatumella citrea]ARU97179.1 SecY-interacting protein [Tatumella citrea]